MSEDLERFVLTHLHSPEELEVLLLLYRGRDRWWSPADTAVAVHMTVDGARAALERLSGAFLDVRIESDVVFRFSEVNAERAAFAARIDQAHRESRAWLMEIVTRHGAARDFADAFRLKEKKR